jgi:effector-binding domain-containing protein
VPALRVAAIRSIIPNYAAQGMLWGELDAYLAQKQITPNGACLAVYYDTEYRERDVDVEACEPISANVVPNGNVKVYELPAVPQVAAVLHRGGFENISESYSQLLQWIGANGFRIVGPNREVYLRAVVSPELLATYPSQYVTTNEAERLTEIQFPIETVK